MSGMYNGCQAILCREQPLAAYVHCSAHCTNLVATAVCSSSAMVRDSIQHVNDFGVLCNVSGNFKSLFSRISMSDDDNHVDSIAAPVRSMKPLCPTRWLVRIPAINATLDQYALILKTLDEAQTSCSPEVSARASGLHARFQDPKTLLSLIMAQAILGPLESLNRALQSTAMTVAGMLEAARTVKKRLIDLRHDDKFTQLLSVVERRIAELHLSPLKVPRERKLPARFSGSGEEFHAK